MTKFQRQHVVNWSEIARDAFIQYMDTTRSKEKKGQKDD